MKMRTMAVAALVMTGGLAIGQTRPGAGPGSAPAEAPIPQNIDRMLDASITIDAEKTTLSEFVNTLRKITNTNIIVNWNALAQSGITRDTPVTLHLKDLSYENVVRTLTEILPVKPPANSPAATAPGGIEGASLGLRPNSLVGENALEITTDADMGKAITSRFYPLGKAVTYVLDGEQVDDRTKLLEQVIHAELARMDEPIDAKGRAVAIKGETMAASVSDRGQAGITRLLTLFNAPVKPGQMAAGMMQTASSKRTQEALAKLFPAWKEGGTGAGGTLTAAMCVEMAKDAKKFGAAVNMALLPGTAEELAKEKPELAGTISDGGVVLIGPTEAMKTRTVFSIYDLHDVIKKQAAKSKPALSAADAQAAIVQAVKGKVMPVGGWGELGKSASALVPYHGVLLVFAPADAQRQTTAVLQEMNR